MHLQPMHRIANGQRQVHTTSPSWEVQHNKTRKLLWRQLVVPSALVAVSGFVFPLLAAAGGVVWGL